MDDLLLVGLFLMGAWYFNLYELSNKSADIIAFISSQSRGTHKARAQRGASIVQLLYGESMTGASRPSQRCSRVTC